MKKIIYKITTSIFVLGLVFLMIISGILGLKSNNNSNFWGGVFGASITVSSSFIILFITILKDKEEQIKSINHQTSINIEQNLRDKYLKEKDTFIKAYSSLEVFLFSSRTLFPENNTLINTLDKLNENYANYRVSTNNLLMLTAIYQINERCIGCSLCDIKMYGEVVRELDKLKILVLDMEKLAGKVNLTQNQNYRVAYELKEIEEKIRITSSIIENNKKIIEIMSNTPNLMNESEIKKKYIENEQEIQGLSELQKDKQAKLDIMKEYSKFNNEKIDELDNIKLKLFNQINSYFTVVNLYIDEYVVYIKKHGQKNKQCKKLDFQNNN